MRSEGEIVEGWEPNTVAGKRIERQKRAEERRRAREDSTTTTNTELVTESRALFRYFCDVDLTTEDLARLMNRGILGGRDVRVRWDESLKEKEVGELPTPERGVFGELQHQLRSLLKRSFL